MQVAVYGKGGIGKSTISSNLSLGLSQHNMKIMQIGCDPKHDSTRLLLGGETQTTVLEYLKNVIPPDRSLNDVIKSGSNGVLCVEAGGPEPGVGCAGRGILTTFATLNELGINNIPVDIRIYDVLGDVVCGGFAVPLRREYSDIIYIVTSGEFMSIYAANNILKGILNFDRHVPRVAGIIFNERGLEYEQKLVNAFSKAVGLPIISTIPRCSEFMHAESSRKTVFEMFPDSNASKALERVVENVINHCSKSLPLFFPKPLDDSQLNDLAAGKEMLHSGQNAASNGKTKKCGYNGEARMKSCAARGASYKLSQITDAAILIHGPKSCGYVMSHTQDFHHLEHILNDDSFHGGFRNNIFCTCLDEDAVISGSNELLSEKLNELIRAGEKEIFVVTTCVSGMIGDDISAVIDEVLSQRPDISISVIQCDGNILGDSDEGRAVAINCLVNLIDADAVQHSNYVNLVDSSFMLYNKGFNNSWTKELLDIFDLKINIQFISKCTIDELKNAKKASFNILVENNQSNYELTNALKSKGMRFFNRPLPHGYSDTISWIKSLSSYLELQESNLHNYISNMAVEYNGAISLAKKTLSGLQMVIICRMHENIDWIIESLVDAEVKILKVCMISSKFSNEQKSAYVDAINIVSASYTQIVSELGTLDSSIILVSSVPIKSGHKFCNIPVTSISHHASIEFLRLLENIVKGPLNEGWKTSVKQI